MPVTTKRIEVPSEPGLTVTIRKLSYWQVKKAKDAKQAEVVAQQGGSGVAIQEVLSKLTPETIAAIQAARNSLVTQDPASFYDMSMTLHVGIVAWSYPEEVDAANIDEFLGLDEADFIFRAIVAYSERTPDEKKGSSDGSVPISEPATGSGPQS